MTRLNLLKWALLSIALVAVAALGLAAGWPINGGDVMGKRRGFTKDTKRKALARSGKKCEAIGAMYGLPDGKRCNADLAFGVQITETAHA